MWSKEAMTRSAAEGRVTSTRLQAVQELTEKPAYKDIALWSERAKILVKLVQAAAFETGLCIDDSRT